MQDRRRYKRISVDFTKMNGNMIFAHAAKIINISISGTAVNADRKLNIGCEYTLTIASEDTRLTLKGVAVWSSLTESIQDVRGNVVPIYSAGLKFVDVSDEKAKEIIRFIKEHGHDTLKEAEIYSHNEQRLHVRVTLEVQENAVLTCHDSYTIKNLSPGGMLIECYCPLEVEDQVPMEITIAGRGKIKFMGRVASSQSTKDKKPAMYELGIEFLGLPQSDKQILNQFINSIEKT
jgi:c-di-GMP-binding flagellar brake protein YcgR